MKKIVLPTGHEVLVDDEDYKYLMQFRWRLHPVGYAMRSTSRTNPGGRKHVLMHREILGAKSGIDVDHINHQRLDNQKTNLRMCTHLLNCHNRGMRRTNRSGCIGVSFDKRRNLWRARIIFRGKEHWLGYFKTKDEANKNYFSAKKKITAKLI